MDEASHRGVGPSHPVGVEAQVQVHQPVTPRRRRWSTAGPACGRGSSAPRRPRGGGSTPVLRRSPGSSACRRRGTARPAGERGRGDGRWPPPRSCGPARPCAGGSGPVPAASPASSGRNCVDQAGLDEEPQARDAGRRPRAACRARRGSARRTRSRAARPWPAPQRHQLGVGLEVVAGDEPGGPQHAQRIVAERLLGPSGVRSVGPRGRRRRRRVHQHRARAARAPCALTVKSRRDRSASTVGRRTPRRACGIRGRRPRRGGS